jgi:hypothetical protein
MGRFGWRLALFALPIALYVAAVVWIDPFDRFGVSSMIAPEAKAIAGPAANAELWTVIKLDRTRMPNILIGDSKMGRLDVQEIQRVSGLEFVNLAMDGSSANDQINLFWRAAKRLPLHEVVFGVNLETFNRTMNRNLIQAAEAVGENPLLYFSSRDVVKASLQLVKAKVRGRLPERPRPAMSKEAFWQYAVTYGARRNLQGFQFDEAVFAELGRIAAYCRSHAIRLRFVLLPTHADIHAQIKTFGLEEVWRATPVRLAGLAETTDFDTENEITANRSLFEDPFHMDSATARVVVDRLFAK